MFAANGVSPPLIQQFPVKGPAFGLDEGIVLVGSGFVDVPWLGHDVEIARQDNRQIARPQLLSMFNEALGPGELVVELGSRPRIAIGRI